MAFDGLLSNINRRKGQSEGLHRQSRIRVRPKPPTKISFVKLQKVLKALNNGEEPEANDLQKFESYLEGGKDYNLLNYAPIKQLLVPYLSDLAQNDPEKLRNFVSESSTIGKYIARSLRHHSQRKLGEALLRFIADKEEDRNASRYQDLFTEMAEGGKGLDLNSKGLEILGNTKGNPFLASLQELANKVGLKDQVTGIKEDIESNSSGKREASKHLSPAALRGEADKQLRRMPLFLKNGGIRYGRHIIKPISVTSDDVDNIQDPDNPLKEGSSIRFDKFARDILMYKNEQDLADKVTTGLAKIYKIYQVRFNNADIESQEAIEKELGMIKEIFLEGYGITTQLKELIQAGLAHNGGLNKKAVDILVGGDREIAASNGLTKALLGLRKDAQSPIHFGQMINGLLKTDSDEIQTVDEKTGIIGKYKKIVSAFDSPELASDEVSLDGTKKAYGKAYQALLDKMYKEVHQEVFNKTFNNKDDIDKFKKELHEDEVAVRQRGASFDGDGGVRDLFVKRLVNMVAEKGLVKTDREDQEKEVAKQVKDLAKKLAGVTGDKAFNNIKGAKQVASTLTSTIILNNGNKDKADAVKKAAEAFIDFFAKHRGDGETGKDAVKLDMRHKYAPFFKSIMQEQSRSDDLAKPLEEESVMRLFDDHSETKEDRGNPAAKLRAIISNENNGKAIDQIAASPLEAGPIASLLFAKKHTNGESDKKARLAGLIKLLHEAGDRDVTAYVVRVLFGQTDKFDEFNEADQQFRKDTRIKAITDSLQTYMANLDQGGNASQAASDAKEALDAVNKLKELVSNSGEDLDLAADGEFRETLKEALTKREAIRSALGEDENGVLVRLDAVSSAIESLNTEEVELSYLQTDNYKAAAQVIQNAGDINSQEGFVDLRHKLGELNNAEAIPSELKLQILPLLQRLDNANDSENENEQGLVAGLAAKLELPQPIDPPQREGLTQDQVLEEIRLQFFGNGQSDNLGITETMLQSLKAVAEQPVDKIGDFDKQFKNLSQVRARFIDLDAAMRSIRNLVGSIAGQRIAGFANTFVDDEKIGDVREAWTSVVNGVDTALDEDDPKAVKKIIDDSLNGMNTAKRVFSLMMGDSTSGLKDKRVIDDPKYIDDVELAQIMLDSATDYLKEGSYALN